ncbi:MAG TPA: cysteine rich repeat-containing protein [Candidatus Acidoferrum sp.]|nr:cysteine rich repeat-containing protein [Candidatus Acidoferrum sp.]
MKVRRIANASCLLLSLTVASVSPARAAQSAQAGDQQSLAAIRAACAEDAQKLCAGVQPGGGRIVACLKEHKDSLSDGCRKAAGLATNPSGSSSAPSAPSTSPTSESQAAGAATSPAAKPSPAAGTGTKAPSQTGAAPTSYLRMKQVQVIAHVADPALGGKVDLPAIDLLIPSTWDFKGSIAANTKEGCFSDIHAVSWEATSPDGSTAFQGAPNDSWQYADGPAALRKLTDPNRRALGAQGKPCPVKKPMKAEDYFRQEILTVFPGGSTVVSVEPFPELNQIARKQLGLPPDDGSNEGSARTEAIRARVKFQKDGKDLEDWVTLVVVTRIFRQGQGAFYDCHAIYVTALRAPQGQLDANDKLFKVMISSIRPEPKWQAYSNGFIAKLYQAEAQKEATMDAMVAAFQKHVADTIMGVTANAQRGAQNSAFGFDQNIRGVQTFRDPTTGNTMELSNQFDHAWLNGSNEYIMSDDPNFNPNGQLSGNWNQMQPVRPAP